METRDHFTANSASENDNSSYEFSVSTDGKSVHAFGPLWDVSATSWIFGCFCPREEGIERDVMGFGNCGVTCEMSESLFRCAF